MNILAIGAHPDDVDIGCGGMLIKAVKNGHSVYLYSVTQGEKEESSTNNRRVEKNCEIYWRQSALHR